MYVCMYVCMYVQIEVWSITTCTYTQTGIYTYMYIIYRVGVATYSAYIHVEESYICTYVCMYVYDIYDVCIIIQCYIVRE